METAFAPISSFGGGMAIGLGAVILMLTLAASLARPVYCQALYFPKTWGSSNGAQL